LKQRAGNRPHQHDSRREKAEARPAACEVLFATSPKTRPKPPTPLLGSAFFDGSAFACGFAGFCGSLFFEAMARLRRGLHRLPR
jgi:hypothetical protein